MSSQGTQISSQGSQMSYQDPSEAVFKILIASDIHLGYNEKDHERGNLKFINYLN